MATFGNTNTAVQTNTTLKDRIKGCYAAPADSGIATSITAYLDHSGVATKYKCALYEYIDYSSSFAGVLIGETEELSVSGTFNDLKQFNFASGSQPSIVGGTNYYIVIFGENAGTLSALSCRTTGTNSMYSVVSYDSFPDPLTGEIASGLYYIIYCTYTPIALPTESLMISRLREITV